MDKVLYREIDVLIHIKQPAIIPSFGLSSANSKSAQNHFTFEVLISNPILARKKPCKDHSDPRPQIMTHATASRPHHSVKLLARQWVSPE